MEETPKRSRREFVRYLILGLLFGLILVGVVSVATLMSRNVPVTLESLIALHLSTPLLLLVDFFALFSAAILGWVGAQKDRLDESQRHAAFLTQQHDQELNQLHENQGELDNQHQAEIVQLNELLDDQGKRFQDLEAIIERGKQQWEATFDAVDDLIILTDEAGVILRCNRATGEVLQTGYSQIVGRGIDELFSNGSNSPGETIPGEKSELHLPNSEVWYQVSKNHLLVDGMQAGWVYIFRDITTQKQALKEQQRLTYYYELVVNNNPAAIVTLNLEDRIIDCNPAFERLFLYSKGESLGKKPDLLIIPPELIYENRGMEESVRKGETVHRVTRRRRKDGSLVDVEVFGIPVILGGKQIGSLVLYHDVSELVHPKKGAPDEPGEAARALMAKFVEGAISSAETAEDVPEAIEADLFQGPGLEQAGEEEFPEFMPAEETETIPPFVQSKKRSTPIEKIEGIGPVYAQRLSEVGVSTTEDLLEQGKSRKGRDDLAEKTGLPVSKVLKWVNMADLMRVHGIGEEFSELLEKAGVDTVKELRNRNPINLFEAMKQVNETYQLVNRLPHFSEVERWINEAKELEPVVTY